MIEWPPGKTILVDGPMAGHLYQVPDDCLSWMVRVPQPLRIPVTSGPGSLLRDEIACYRTTAVVYNHGYDRHPARVGWTGPEPQPTEADLLEHVPTGLAEQGMLPWDAVPVTAADRATPVGIEAFGDPLKQCALERIDASWGWLTDLAGVCACGWRTERVPMNRRAQLVRAAGWHKSAEETRRARFHLPIRLVSEGCGAQPDCYGGMAFDKDTLLARGVCRRCGWETERVEPYRTAPLQKLCQAHTGPDGVRRVRNQLLAAYGLPLPEEEPALAMWGVHSTKLCADSHSEDAPLWERCLDGTVYGGCGHENCYGACEDMGRCPCVCHREALDDD